MKSLNVSAKTWKKVQELKLEWEKKNAEEVMEEIFKRANIKTE